jgi:hypothetical protein
VYESALQHFPQFAVSSWFWQACLLLVILSSFNPTTIGQSVWGFPTIKCLLEIAITRSWKFPPFLSAQDKLTEEAVLVCLFDISFNSAQANELHLQKSEKEKILMLENALAQGMSEQNKPLIDLT